MKDDKMIRDTIMECVVKAGSGMLQNNYFVIFFVSCIDGELHAYDTREPLRACKDVLIKNPEFEFLSVESAYNEKAVRDISSAVRLTRKLRGNLIPQAESIKIDVIADTTKEKQVI